MTIRSHAKKFAIASAVAVACLVSCSKTPPPDTYQPEDFADAGNTFDPDEIVDAMSFVDTTTYQASDIEAFLLRPPYSHANSFLSSYVSNDMTAADAVENASVTYGIHPLFLLAAAEAAEGLVGRLTYPSNPALVEYVFNCGCDGDGNCDIAYAGFDKQVACLASSLRQSLDQIAANGTTAGGWGPNATSTTLDGIAIVPDDASTAAIYQYEPVVDVNHGGTWLLWNIWELYDNAQGFL
jgi:hypothetical protein